MSVVVFPSIEHVWLMLPWEVSSFSLVWVLPLGQVYKAEFMFQEAIILAVHFRSALSRLGSSMSRADDSSCGASVTVHDAVHVLQGLPVCFVIVRSWFRESVWHRRRLEFSQNEGGICGENKVDATIHWSVLVDDQHFPGRPHCVFDDSRLLCSPFSSFGACTILLVVWGVWRSVHNGVYAHYCFGCLYGCYDLLPEFMLIIASVVSMVATIFFL